MKPLRILIANDDGIHAPGLKVLERIARSLSDDVWVVAPELEQSGASHSLTLHDPLRLREVGERWFAVRGTPTDCVMMAVKHIIPDRPPDLILSGVNRGTNLAEDVTYSGTVAAAMEGAVLGIPSVALSQSYRYESRHQVKWACAEYHGPRLLKRLLDSPWPQDVLLNVNFPDLPYNKVKGVEVTVQGRRDQSEVRIDARTDARGVDYFWIGFQRQNSNPVLGTDLYALRRGYISLTPLHLDLTHHESRERLSRCFEDFGGDTSGAPTDFRSETSEDNSA